MKKLQQALVKAFSFLLRHPVILFALILILLLVFIIIVIVLDEDVGATGSGAAGNGARNCTYELAGVVSTGEVTMTGIKVELINCDGSASEYTVLDNVDFEKYVLGVALAEIGPDAPDEALKAQIVAARNFAFSKATCDYIYSADADEVLEEKDRKKFLQLKQGEEILKPLA